MDELLQALLDRLSLITELNNIAIYNKQLANTDDSVLTPAVLIEVYGNVDYTQLLGNMQAGECTLRFHIIDESPQQGYDMDIYKLKEKVSYYLQGYTNGKFMRLVRTGEELDTNHSNIYNYKQDYKTRFTEDLTLLPVNTVTLNEIDVKYDLYNDGDEIKTDIIN